MTNVHVPQGDVIPMPGRFINCPLCAWRFEIPPLAAGIGPDTLAGVFGPNIFLHHAINSQVQKTEEQLRKHLETHKLEEWVTKVSTLEHQLMLAQAALDGAYV